MNNNLISKREVELTNLLAHVMDEKAAAMKYNAEIKNALHILLVKIESGEFGNDVSDLSEFWKYINGHEYPNKEVDNA